MYKLIQKVDDRQMDCVLRTADMTCIPFDPANTDYQQYLKWVADGNTPLPADEQGEQA